MKKLLDTDTLELSGVVANSAMNRERICVGKNSYARSPVFMGCITSETSLD